MTDPNTTNDHLLKWSTPLFNTATPNSTPIYRSFDPTISPRLGCLGCQTMYEGLRRGLAVNPFGPCLGFRAVSTSGNATPFVYSSYTEIVARVDALAAGLDDLNLLKRNEDGFLLVR
jgi:long-chain acyl-CoA synthetase